MPYIEKRERVALDLAINELRSTLSFRGRGSLNYVITRLVDPGLDVGYSAYEAALGTLEAVKLELYRRRIAHYEDTKIKDNGDVY